MYSPSGIKDACDFSKSKWLCTDGNRVTAWQSFRYILFLFFSLHSSFKAQPGVFFKYIYTLPRSSRIQNLLDLSGKFFAAYTVSGLMAKFRKISVVLAHAWRLLDYVIHHEMIMSCIRVLHVHTTHRVLTDQVAFWNSKEPPQRTIWPPICANCTTYLKKPALVWHICC